MIASNFRMFSAIALAAVIAIGCGMPASPSLSGPAPDSQKQPVQPVARPSKAQPDAFKLSALVSVEEQPWARMSPDNW
jgi:hypothetical protein